MSKKWTATFGIAAFSLALLGGCGDSEPTTCSGNDCSAGGQGGVSTSVGGSGGVGAAGASGPGGAGAMGASGGSGGAPALETVRVLSSVSLEPLADVVVFASDSSGDLADETITDERGVAMIDVPDGGLVSAALSVGADLPQGVTLVHRVHTVAEVPDGGEVIFRLYDYEPIPEPELDTMTVEVSENATVPLFFSRLLVRPSCTQAQAIDFNAEEVVFEGFEGCDNEPYDIVVVRDDESGAPGGASFLDWMAWNDQPFVPNSTQAFVIDNASLSDEFANVAASYQNIPSPDYVVLGVQAGDWSTITHQIDDPGQAVQALVRVLPKAAGWDTARVSHSLRWDQQENGLNRGSYETMAVEQLSASYDYDFSQLCLIDDLQLLDISDLSRPEVHWTWTTEPMDGYLIIETSWAEEGVFTSWTGFLPVLGGTYRLPELPISLADYGVKPGTELRKVGVSAYDYEGFTGIVAAVNNPTPIPSRSSCWAEIWHD